MELSARLQSIADQVPQGAIFADIGTDHAYLPVWLLLEKRIDRAIAADLREGPLSRARETAEQFGVSEKVSFRLCNGLVGIAPHEVDTIAIAGMGGETIAEILSAAPWTKENTLLLLQPMTSFPDLRLWLQENGYQIEKEVISQEGRRLYSSLIVRGGKMPAMTAAELWVGRNVNDPLRPAFLTMMEEKLNRAMQGQMSATEPNEAEVRYLKEILLEIADMKGAL